MRCLLVAIVALILVAGAEDRLAAQPSASAPRSRVLFVGNSLTYVNDLPAMIEAVAAQAGLAGRITTRAVALPDMGLEEHWNHGDALRAIQQGGWTHVVLQQGPSSLPESQAILREFTKKFAFEIRRAGARVVLYSVWPPRARAAFFDAVTAGYAKARRLILRSDNPAAAKKRGNSPHATPSFRLFTSPA